MRRRQTEIIKPIVKDIMFLGQKSEPATVDDRQIITELQDILKAHRDGCVGMAANMIGYKKRIIVVSLGFANLIMQNPVIKAKSGKYENRGKLPFPDGQEKDRTVSGY